jgi:eukaryotic-like serine/threonine-protein kinase
MGLAPGSRVGAQVVLERMLGRGAMGVVWRARHEGLGISVAVKVLAGALMAQPEARARFDREARAIARIESQHVVRLSDVGRTPEGDPYIVMELLSGRDLKEHLAETGPFQAVDAAILVEQICDALGRAHALGIIHRDVKPANIFLVEGPRIFAKVLDFGIAKLTAEPSTMLTATEALLGTPYYMSPEQFIDPRTIDYRSDLWSVAVVAYACLTCTLPFMEETVGGLALAVHAGRFAPPSSNNP